MRFSDDDRSNDPDERAAYLARSAGVEELAQRKLRSYEWQHLSPGDRIADIGVGVGVDLEGISHRIGFSGLILAIDVSEALLRQALDHRTTAHVARLRADASHLPLASRSVQAARLDRVLMHVDSPVAVVREAMRIVETRGTVYLGDPAGIHIDHPDSEMSALIAEEVAATMPQGWAGRSHQRWAKECGAAGTVEWRADVTRLSYSHLRWAFDVDQALSSIVRRLPSREEQVVRWARESEALDAQGRFTCLLVFHETLLRPDLDMIS